MNYRAGGQIIKGKIFYWTDWTHDEVSLDLPMCKIPDMVMPDDLLVYMFDEKRSGELMPMPRDVWN